MAISVSAKPRRAPVEPALDLKPLDAAMGRRHLQTTMPLSLALHALALIALFVVPVLTSMSLPEPTAAVRAFFVEPAVNAAPAPPPPPPAIRSAGHRSTEPRLQESRGFIAPLDIPAAVPKPGLDLGVDGGVPGGVEGGVEGGVVGGVVGGIPSAPAPPKAPVRVGGAVEAPTRVTYVAPEYPSLARRAHVSGIVVIDAVLSPDGRVTGAKVLRSIPMLDEAALTAVRQWIYSPTLLDGVPVSVEMTVTVTFVLKN